MNAQQTPVGQQLQGSLPLWNPGIQCGKKHLRTWIATWLYIHFSPWMLRKNLGKCFWATISLENTPHSHLWPRRDWAQTRSAITEENLISSWLWYIWKSVYSLRWKLSTCFTVYSLLRDHLSQSITKQRTGEIRGQPEAGMEAYSVKEENFEKERKKPTQDKLFQNILPLDWGWIM